jgi:CelD/BcsL family acetyltransferase involved in cellulose biosynthesis
MSSTALFRTEADVARRGIEQSGAIFVETSLGKISLQISADWPRLRTDWEELQRIAPCSAAQTYDWAHAYARHVVGPEGRDAVIARGHGADGALLFLWPFEVGTTGGIRVLSWLGHDHANYNMGLFAPAAEELSAADLRALLNAIGRETGAAVAILTAQPDSWDGVPNPFAQLPHQPSPNSGYVVKLGDFDALFNGRFSKRSRSTLRRKERKLLETVPVSYGWADAPHERIELLDTFFAQKALQFAAMGVKEVFDAHARAFYREVALLDEDNPSRLHLGYIRAGDVMAATFSGTVFKGRAAVSLSSLVDDAELQRYSPGALLLQHQIKEACEKGLTLFDMGAGEARHKIEWCEITLPLFDSFIALTARGHFLTGPLALTARAKRTIKTNSYLWPLVRRLRRSLLSRNEAKTSERSDASEES